LSDAIEDLTKRVEKLEENVKNIVFKVEGLDAALTNAMREIESLRRRAETAIDPSRWFPEKYIELLDFKVEGNHVIAKPRKYLGEAFRGIAAIVKKLNGEYVSAGRESHFKFPLNPSAGNGSTQSLVRSAWDEGREFNSGGGRWVFSRDYQRLRDILMEAGRSMIVVVDGREFRVKLSGDKAQFISLFPISRRGK